MAETYRFKYYRVDQDGNTTTTFAYKGEFDGETLKLDNAEVPAEVIGEVETRGKYLFFSAVDEADEVVVLTLQITSGSAAKLRELLGRARSAKWAEAHEQEMIKQGQGHTFRKEICPHCDATINLTNMAVTPQVYCEFCHRVGTLTTALESSQAGEKDYGLCDECGMYSQPRKFTMFYFYFLLVVYGWSSNETYRCPACMRGEAWKMLAGNFLFVLGVPFALLQLFRAYGGTDIGSLYGGLDKANLLARGKKFENAVEAYQAILKKTPLAAGVKYNIALAFLHNDDTEGASHMLEFVLKDCANYEPAAATLLHCYTSLNETEKLTALKELWGVTDDVES